MPTTIDLRNLKFRPPPAAMTCLHIVAKSAPGWRFEYHPQTRKVYAVRLGVRPEIADLLAERISSHDDARQIVQVFLRGIAEERTKQLGAGVVLLKPGEG